MNSPIFTPSTVCRLCGYPRAHMVQTIDPRRRGLLRAALWCTAVMIAFAVLVMISGCGDPRPKCIDTCWAGYAQCCKLEKPADKPNSHYEPCAAITERCMAVCGVQP